VVIGMPSLRANANDVRSLPIDTAGGGHVPLSSIASVSVGPDPFDIEHEALSRYVDVTAPVYLGGIGAAQAAIARRLGQIGFPLDYHAEVVGGTPEDPTSHLKFLSYVLAALVGILLLFQAAFGSWRLAAILLLGLPVSLAGGLIVALLSGQVHSLGVDAGLLAVFAFSARQALLQVTAVRRRHAADRGELSAETVAAAARERLAPALTAIVVSAAVLIPFAVMGDVAGNEITHTAADVMLGGLVSSLVLTQVLVPVMCLALGPTEPIAVEEPADDGLDLAAVPAPSTSGS
jgi:Cu/Ag efflux pump CusA